MESFELKKGGDESEQELKARAEWLAGEIDRLIKISKESGENIDAELGSEAYVDHGYMAQARELQEELNQINTSLAELDDMRANQRNLPL